MHLRCTGLVTSEIESVIVKEQLQQRLEELKTEYKAGQKMLTELEAQKTNLKETLLRISGAIQVLEEELARTEKNEAEVTNLVTNETSPVQ